MLLGLFQEWSQSLGHIGQIQFVRLSKALPVALQLVGLQAQICLQSVATVVCSLDRRHYRRGFPSQERHLFGQDLRVRQLLTDVEL